MSRLAAYVHITDPEHGSHVFGPDDDVPGWAEKRIDNPKAWAEPPAAAGEPYKGVKVDDLKAEIARRNAGRPEAEHIPSDGKRDDLVAALVADDNR